MRLFPVGGIILLVAIGLIVLCCGEAPEPTRPNGVPKKAQWAGGEDGGAWIECDKPEGREVYCRIYHEYLNEIVAEGHFRLRGGNAISEKVLQFDFFDGRHIYLKNGNVLDPASDLRFPILNGEKKKRLK